MERSYESGLARFTSPDPLVGSFAAPQSLNRYAYVSNDPINFTDPSGLTRVCSLVNGPDQVSVCINIGPDMVDGQGMQDLFGGGGGGFGGGGFGIGILGPGLGGIPLPGCFLPGACNVQLSTLGQTIGSIISGIDGHTVPCPDLGPCPGATGPPLPFAPGAGTIALDTACIVLEPCGVDAAIALGLIFLAQVIVDDPQDDDNGKEKRDEQGRGYEVCRLAGQMTDPDVSQFTICAYTCEHPPLMTTIVPNGQACPSTQIRIHNPM